VPPEPAPAPATSEPELIPPTSVTNTGWAPPPAQGSGIGVAKGCAIVAAIVVALGGLLVTFAIVALIFLGGQVASILQGTVQFGTGGNECSVTGVASTFPSTASIHLAAHLERTVAAGEVITMVVTGPDGEVLTTSEPPSPSSFECIYNDITPGLPPGPYAIEFLVGQERLASGSFEITP
jgi:hypothetical protein